MSTVPSWVTLGIVVGFFAGWTAQREKAEAQTLRAGRLAGPPVPPPLVRLEPAPLSRIEAVFEDWGQHAVWWDDKTEVALWNSETKSFSEFYEVRKLKDELFFRSIPKLSRLEVRHGKPLTESPLVFTETAEQYREWLQHGRSERQAPTLPK